MGSGLSRFGSDGTADGFGVSATPAVALEQAGGCPPVDQLSYDVLRHADEETMNHSGLHSAGCADVFTGMSCIPADVAGGGGGRREAGQA